MNNAASFGQWIKQRRKALDLTQLDLAGRVGCALVTIRKIEADERRPSFQIIERLAEHLKIGPEQWPIFMRFARAQLDIDLLSLPPSAFGVLSERTLRRTNMPSPLTPLIGRDHDAAIVRERLLCDEGRLLTLLGPPGVGKTRLGIQVAIDLIDSFADGAFFVALAPIRDPDLVVARITQALGLVEIGNQPPFVRLTEVLQDKRLLLLLDNFEHVADAGPIVADLLEACPRLKVLVTSREALNVRGEEVFCVPPLALPDLANLPAAPEAVAAYPAIALFVVRAQAVKRGFTLTEENAAPVATICARLDGLPLAIELVAAYARLFSPAALLAHLTLQFKLLTAGARDLPKHQQTLWGAIDWSYDLLSADERTLFTRLAVFVGGCTLEAAAAVANTAGDLKNDLLGGIISLLNKSLLYRVDGVNGELRFAMLETIREYGMDRLVASGESTALRRRHAEFFLDLAEVAEPDLRGPRQGEWLPQLDLEHNNMHAALAWSQSAPDGAEIGLRLAGALWWFWHRRGHMNEGRQRIEAALAHDETATQTAIRAKALLGAGVLVWLQGDYSLAGKWLEESLEIWRRIGDKRGIAYTLNYQGMAALVQGNTEGARSLQEESLTISREIGDQWGLALALRTLGTVVLFQGDVVLEKSLYEESLAIFREIGDSWGIAVALNDLGETARLQGDYERAACLYEECLTLLRQVGDRWLLAIVLHNLGYVAQYWCDYGKAAALYEESLAIWREVGNKRGIALCLHGLAGVAIAGGQPAEAVRLLGAAEAMLDALGILIYPADRAEYDRSVAAAHAQLDDVTFAALWAKGRKMSLEQVTAYTWIYRKHLGSAVENTPQKG